MHKRVFRGHFSFEQKQGKASIKMYDGGELIMLAEIAPFELGAVVFAELRNNPALCDDLANLHDIRKAEGKRGLVNNGDDDGFIERLLTDDGLRETLGSQVTSALKKLKAEMSKSKERA